VIPQISLALLTLIGALSTAEKIRFDPTRDLPGYETVRASPDRTTTRSSPSKCSWATRCSPRSSRGAQALGSRARRLGREARGAVADPRAAFLFRLQLRLARHTFFSKIGWTLEEVPAPFALVLQRPSKDDPKHAAAIVELYKPWLAALATEFDGADRRNRPGARRARTTARWRWPCWPRRRFLDGREVPGVRPGLGAGRHLRSKLRLGASATTTRSAARRARATASARCSSPPPASGCCTDTALRTRCRCPSCSRSGTPPYLFECLGDGKTKVETPVARLRR
jgi:hypothetical protein